MGTWDVGPFDNDTAADLGGDLDDAAEGDREGMLRSILTRTADAQGYLDQDIAVEAVAAAALIAAQCPGGDPVTTAYGPKLPIPELPLDLRELAVRALARVVTEPSELLELWGENEVSGPWRATIVRLSTVLLPPMPREQLQLC